MFRRSLVWLALPALSLALLWTSPVAAGPLRGAWGSYGNGYYANNGYYGNGFYANNGYYGNGPYANNGFYGNNYYGGETGNYAAWYDPPSGGNGVGYGNHFYYGSSYSPWYGYGYGWNAFPVTSRWSYRPATYSSGYAGPGASAVSPKAARIDVRVPADAYVWFGSGKTVQTGPYREFVTPDLGADVDNVYTLRARWVETGHVVEQTRRVRVTAGGRVMVDFFQPAPAERADNPSINNDETTTPRITGRNETPSDTVPR